MTDRKKLEGTDEKPGEANECVGVRRKGERVSRFKDSYRMRSRSGHQKVK